MVRKRGGAGPRTPAAQQARHRGTKAEEGPRDTPQQQRASHTRKRHRPTFAEDEVDLALSRNIAQLLYQAECEKIEVAQRAINVKTRCGTRWRTGVTCTTARVRVRAQARGRRPPTLSRTARGGGQAVPVHAGVRARGAAVWAVVCARVGPRRRLALPEEATFSRELRDTYAAPSRAATAHIVEACGLQLPVGPATALEEVVAREPVLRELFQDRHVAIRKCAVCGAAEVLHGEGGNFQTVSGGMVALLPPQRAPVHLDADAVMACVKSTQVDHTISCTGRAKGRQHAPAPVATEQSRVFSEAVAVEIGMWGDDLLAWTKSQWNWYCHTRMGRRRLASRVWWQQRAARTWRPSCRARANTARGTCTTGWCTEWCRMGRNPRRWSCSFIGVVVMRTLTWMVWSAAWASTTRTRSVRRKVRVRRRTSSTHRSGRATRSHRQCRRKCPETSVAEERLAASEREPVAHRMQRGATWTRRTGRRRWLSFFALWANTWRKHTTVMRPRACLMTRRRVSPETHDDETASLRQCRE
ncbi:hypothetical protein ERJ75_000917000 [Trypanosoma vivax]|nr:hypothetical protein ERJ75_000917000 [Trypanosoma vivax]